MPVNVNLFILLADSIAIAHVAYILFVVGGQGLIMMGWARQWQWTRHRLFRLIHLAAIALVVIEVWSGIYCPLTLLENYFRSQAGDIVYSSSFVGYWIDSLIYYTAPEWVFTLLYSIFFIFVLLTYLAYPPRRVKSSDQAGYDDSENDL